VPPKALRRLCWLRDSNPVPEELRGWSWGSPPVRPRAYFGLGVSEVAYRYCETFRDLWLRRRGGAEPRVERGSPLWWGRLAHALLDAAAKDAAELCKLPLPEAARRVAALSKKRALEAGAGVGELARARGFYEAAALELLARARAWAALRGEGARPSLPLTEYAVDGSPLGLSPRLRVDALLESGVVTEYKVGSLGQNGVERVAVALAGYAMALEADLEAPFDFGVVVSISEVSASPQIRAEPVYLGPGLRRQFLENRDEAIEVLMSYRPPPRAQRCSPSCPLKHACEAAGP